jgi:hypothetical protein
VVSVTPRTRFTPAEGLSVPNGQEAGWALELVWTQSLEKKSFASAGNRTTVVQYWVQICAIITLVKKKLFYYTPQRRLGGEEVWLLLIFDLGTRWGWVVSVTPRPRFIPGKDPQYHCTGGWVGPRAGLDTEAREKTLSPLPGIEPRSLGRPAHSQTLYWLSYPGSRIIFVTKQ